MKQNSQESLVSVVIPVFNAQNTIKDCLTSLQNQTYRNVEIIVINDGSTDATEAILNNLSQEIPMKVVDIKHKGRSSARNIGIAQANGQIIAFGEADAKCNSDWLATAIKHLDNERIAGVVGPRYCWITDTFVSKCIDLELKIRYHDPLFDPIAGWIYKKQVLLQVGAFDEKLRVAEDRDLGIRIKEKGYKIAFEPNSSMWHMEPRSVSELIKKTFTHSKERAYFFLKYPQQYPVSKVTSFIIYIILISLSILNPLFILLLGVIPLLTLAQFLRLSIKAKRSNLFEHNLKCIMSIASLEVIRNIFVVLGSISALKTIIQLKLHEYFG